jgi:hypothetical protein
MSKYTIPIPTMVLALTLVGCAGPMGTMRPGPSLTAAEEVNYKVEPPVTAFDGSYRNTIRIITSFGSGADNSGWCTSPGQPIITIANGQFTYAVPHPNVPGNATPVYQATMKEDGSFYGSITAGVVSGAVEGTRIVGKIDGSACLYAFSGQRV